MILKYLEKHTEIKALIFIISTLFLLYVGSAAFKEVPTSESKVFDFVITSIDKPNHFKVYAMPENEIEFNEWFYKNNSTPYEYLVYSSKHCDNWEDNVKISDNISVEVTKYSNGNYDIVPVFIMSDGVFGVWKRFCSK